MDDSDPILDEMSVASNSTDFNSLPETDLNDLCAQYSDLEHDANNTDFIAVLHTARNKPHLKEHASPFQQQLDSITRPHAHSDDNVSIMTPSTVSSDDADLGFSSDEDTQARRGYSLDFSRLARPVHKEHEGGNRNDSSVLQQDDELYDQVDDDSVLEPPCVDAGDFAGNQGNARKSDRSYSSCDTNDNRDCFDHDHDSHCDADDVYINDSNGNTEEDNGEDNDDESIGWVPTPGKPSSEPANGPPVTSQERGLTFSSLLDKFNKARDHIPHTSSTQLHQSLHDSIADHRSRSSSSSSSDSSAVASDKHLATPHSYHNDSREFENLKQQFYKDASNSASPRGSPKHFGSHRPHSDSSASTTTNSSSLLSVRSDYVNDDADSEQGNRGQGYTRRPPPPSSAPPPLHLTTSPASLRSQESHESFHLALSSIIGAQDSDSDGSELVDQLSRYDEDDRSNNSENDSDSEGQGDTRQVRAGGEDFLLVARRPQVPEEQTREVSHTASESILILQELNDMGSSFGQHRRAAVVSAPLPSLSLPQPRAAPPSAEAVKDTFPIFATRPRGQQPAISVRSAERAGARAEVNEKETGSDSDYDSDSEVSACNSDKELARLVKILPTERRLEDHNHSAMDEEEEDEEEEHQEVIGAQDIYERVSDERDEEEEGEEVNMFAEASTMDLFNDSLSRQQLLHGLLAPGVHPPQANGQDIMMSPLPSDNFVFGHSSPSRSTDKEVSRQAVAQRTRKDAIAAFRQSDVDATGTLVFREFCHFLELTGFFPRSVDTFSPTKQQHAGKSWPLAAGDESFFSQGVKPKIHNTVHMNKSPPVTTRAERLRLLDIQKKSFLLAHTIGSYNDPPRPNQAPVSQLAHGDLVFHPEVETVTMEDVIKFLAIMTSSIQFKDKVISRLVTELRNRRRMYKQSSTKTAVSSPGGNSRSKTGASPLSKTDKTLSQFTNAANTTGTSASRQLQSSTKSVTSCSTFFSERGAEYGLSSDEAREVYRERRWNKVLHETAQAREKELTFHPHLAHKPPPPPPPPLDPNNSFSSDFEVSELNSTLPPPELQLSKSGKSLAYTNLHNFDKEKFKNSKSRPSEELELEEHCRFAPKTNGPSPFVSERELASITQRVNASAPPPPPPPRHGIVRCGQSLQEAKENEIMTIPLDPTLNIYYYNLEACPPMALPVVIPDAPALPGSAWLAFTERDVQKSKVNFVIKKKSAAEKEALAKAKPAFGSLLEELNFKLKGIGTEDSLIKLRPAPTSQRLNMGGGKKGKKKKTEGFENLMDEMKFMLARLNKSRDNDGSFSSEEEEEEEDDDEEEEVKPVLPKSDEIERDGIKKGSLNSKLMAMLSPPKPHPFRPAPAADPAAAQVEEKPRNPVDLRHAVEHNRFNIPAAPPLPGMAAWAAPISFELPPDDFSGNQPPPLHLSVEESSDSRPPGYYLPAPDHVRIAPGQIVLAAKVGEHEGIDYLVQVRLFREQEQDFRVKRRVSLASQLVKTFNETKGRGGLRTGDVLITPDDIEMVKAIEYHDDLTVISQALKNRMTPQDLPIPNKYYEDIKRKLDNKKHREAINQTAWNNGMRNYSEEEIKKKNSTYLDSVTKQHPFKFSTTARKKNKVISFRQHHTSASKQLAITEFVAANSGFLNQSSVEGDLGAKLWTSNLRNHTSKQKGMNEKAAPIVTPTLKRTPSTSSEDARRETEYTRGGLPRSYPESPRSKPEAPSLHYYNRSEVKAIQQMRKKEEDEKELRLKEKREKDRKRYLREKAKAVMAAVQRDQMSPEHIARYSPAEGRRLVNDLPPPASSFARSLSKMATSADSTASGVHPSLFLHELDTCFPDAESVYTKVSVTPSQMHAYADDYMSDDETEVDPSIYHTMNVDVDLSSYCDDIDDDSVLDDYYDTETTNISVHSMISEGNGMRAPNSEIMGRKSYTPLKNLQERRQRAQEAVSTGPPPPPPPPQRQGFSRMPSMTLGNPHTSETPDWADTSLSATKAGMAPEFKDSRVRYRELAALKEREKVIQQRLDRATKKSRAKDVGQKERDRQVGEQQRLKQEQEDATAAAAAAAAAGAQRQSQPINPLTQQSPNYANNPDLEEARKAAGIYKPKMNLKMLFGDLDEVTSEEDKRGVEERKDDNKDNNDDDDLLHPDDFDMNALQGAILRRNSDMMAGQGHEGQGAQDRRASRASRAAAANTTPAPMQRIPPQEVALQPQHPPPGITNSTDIHSGNTPSPKKTPVRRASTLFANIEFASDSALKRSASLETPLPLRRSSMASPAARQQSVDFLKFGATPATRAGAGADEGAGGDAGSTAIDGAAFTAVVDEVSSLDRSDEEGRVRPDPTVLENVRRLSGAGRYGFAGPPMPTGDMRETLRQVAVVRRSLKATDYHMDREEDREEEEEGREGVQPESTMQKMFPFRDQPTAAAARDEPHNHDDNDDISSDNGDNSGDEDRDEKTVDTVSTLQSQTSSQRITFRSGLVAAATYNSGERRSDEQTPTWHSGSSQGGSQSGGNNGVDGDSAPQSEHNSKNYDQFRRESDENIFDFQEAMSSPRSRAQSDVARPYVGSSNSVGGEKPSGSSASPSASASRRRSSMAAVTTAPRSGHVRGPNPAPSPSGKHSSTLISSLLPQDMITRTRDRDVSNGSVSSSSSSQYEQVLEGHKKKMHHVARPSLYAYNAQRSRTAEDAAVLGSKHEPTASATNTRRRSSMAGITSFSSMHSTTAITCVPEQRGPAPEKQYEDLLQGHKKKMTHVPRQSLYAYHAQQQQQQGMGRGGGMTSALPQLSSTTEQDDDNDYDEDFQSESSASRASVGGSSASGSQSQQDKSSRAPFTSPRQQFGNNEENIGYEFDNKHLNQHSVDIL